MRAALGLVLSLVSCEAVAPVDVHYAASPDASAEEAGSDAANDAGPLTVAEGSALGDGGTCGCDMTAGLGCCLQKGSASVCTAAGPACSGAGGIFLGCVSSTMDSECCWGAAPPGAGGYTSFRASCGTGPRSCATTSDCLSGTCQLVTCGGVNVGACGVTPLCP
jgi:hypothetical protein